MISVSKLSMCSGSNSTFLVAIAPNVVRLNSARYCNHWGYMQRKKSNDLVIGLIDDAGQLGVAGRALAKTSIRRASWRLDGILIRTTMKLLTLGRKRDCYLPYPYNGGR